MCRLAYIPNPKNCPFPLEPFFSGLEKAMGGHGNGIGWFEGGKKKQTISVEKGVEMSVEEAADTAYMAKTTSGVIFHTRARSSGSIKDANCHPYGKRGVIVCHNGTWRGADDLRLPLLIAKRLTLDKALDCTDSEIIATMVAEHGFEITQMVSSGVILALYPQCAKVYVKGDFEAVMFRDAAGGQHWFYGSEFPDWIIKHAEMWRGFNSGSVATLREDGYKLHRGSTKKDPPQYRRSKTSYSYSPNRGRNYQHGSYGASRNVGGFGTTSPPTQRSLNEVQKKVDKQLAEALEALDGGDGYYDTLWME